MFWLRSREKLFCEMYMDRILGWLRRLSYSPDNPMRDDSFLLRSQEADRWRTRPRKTPCQDSQVLFSLLTTPQNRTRFYFIFFLWVDCHALTFREPNFQLHSKLLYQRCGRVMATWASPAFLLKKIKTNIRKG